MGEQSTQGSDISASIAAEARRLYARYAQEVIEDFGFCPWAQEARRSGQVQVEVCMGTPRVAATLALMEHLAEHHDIVIGLAIFPEAMLGRLAFQHFAAAVREADRQAHGSERSPTWAVADFHPDAQPDLENPERLVGFIRRSPDPTLQLVRHSVLSHIRRGDDGGTRFLDPQAFDMSTLVGELGTVSTPVHTRVAQRNLQTVKIRGVAEVERRIEDIHRDRDNTYARLGLPTPPWRRP